MMTYDEWLAHNPDDTVQDTIQCTYCGAYMTSNIESGACGDCEEAGDDVDWQNQELQVYELSVGDLLRLQHNVMRAMGEEDGRIL